MAFTGFTDRVVQHPGRMIMTPVQGEANTYDMSRAEGTITVPGTPFNAETFNAIADDIIQMADDNIITAAELAALASDVGVSTEKIYNIVNAIAGRPYITEEKTIGTWRTRKWSTGKEEAWSLWDNSGTATPTSVWVAPIRYKDLSITIPSGVFTATPRMFAESRNNQMWIVHANSASSTTASVRVATLSSADIIPYMTLYGIKY